MKFKTGDIVTVVKKYPSNNFWTWVEGAMDKHIGQQGEIVTCSGFYENGKQVPSYQIAFAGTGWPYFFREECLALSETIMTLINY